MTPVKKRDNPLFNLLINIVIPSVILIQFSSVNYLGPLYALVTALSFPTFFGLYSFWKIKKIEYISVIGLISVLLTGIFGILELDPEWIAIKEAGIPLLLGLLILISLKTPFPVVKKLIYNEQFFNVNEIDLSLELKNKVYNFERRLTIATIMLAGSFFLSAILNYILASLLLVSPPGSEAFNTELGKMTAYSFPVIAIPCSIIMFGVLYFLVHSIKSLSGLSLSEIFKLGEKV